MCEGTTRMRKHSVRKASQIAVCSVLSVGLSFGIVTWSGLERQTMKAASASSQYIQEKNQKLENAESKDIVSQKTDTKSDANAVTSDFSVPNSMVRFVPYGPGLSPTQIAHVEKIFSEVDPLARIQQRYHLQLELPETIYLVNTTAAYSAVLQKLGVGSVEANTMSTDTGGFTLDSSVVIPLPQNPSDMDIANSLTHESTHVIFNQNIGSLPSWINEGLAVFMGMNGQSVIENPVEFAGDERQLAENILDVVASHQLVPLTGNESAILTGKETYDFELQDWLAMSDLISHKGFQSVQQYLSLMRQTHNDPSSFKAAFGESEKTFNAQFTKELDRAVNPKNQGVSMKLNISPQFTGTIQVQAPNSPDLQVFSARNGQYQMNIGPKGKTTSQLRAKKTISSPDTIDPYSLNIAVYPAEPLMVGNQLAQNGEFTFDFHNNLYAFESTTINFKNGQSTYNYNPSVLGVSISSAQELNSRNPVVQMLAAERITP